MHWLGTGPCTLFVTQHTRACGQHPAIVDAWELEARRPGRLSAAVQCSMQGTGAPPSSTLTQEAALASRLALLVHHCPTCAVMWDAERKEGGRKEGEGGGGEGEGRGRAAAWPVTLGFTLC